MRSLTLFASVVFAAAAVFAAPTSPNSLTRPPLVKRAGSRLTPKTGAVKPLLSPEELKSLVATTSEVLPAQLNELEIFDVSDTVNSWTTYTNYEYTNIAFNSARVNKNTVFYLKNGDIKFRIGLDLNLVADYFFDIKRPYWTTYAGQMTTAIKDALVSGTLSVTDGKVVAKNVEAKIDKFTIEMNDSWLVNHVEDFIRTTEKKNYETQLSGIVVPSVSSIVNEMLSTKN